MEQARQAVAGAAMSPSRSSADDFDVRGAPLDYWFVKVADGDLAFLVD